MVAGAVVTALGDFLFGYALGLIHAAHGPRARDEWSPGLQSQPLLLWSKLEHCLSAQCGGTKEPNKPDRASAPIL